MTTRTTRTTTRMMPVALMVAMTVVAPALQGCSHALMMVRGTGIQRPAVSEFGPGPRTSAAGTYVATLEPAAPLRPRRLQTVQVVVRDAAGRAIEDAQIAIDGGMPQHGHGLPTRPRVTRALGDGRYEIEGVRFNMGGWWQFRLAITGALGADTITFNLAI